MAKQDNTRPLITAGPFKGVNDAIPLAAQSNDRLSAMTNGYIRSPELGDDVTCRPGIFRKTLSGVTVGTNAVTPTGIRGLTFLQVPGGTQYNLLVVKLSAAPTVVGDYFTSTGPIIGGLVQWGAGANSYLYALDTIAQTNVTFNVDATRLWFTAFHGFLVLNDGQHRLVKWQPGASPSITVTAANEIVYGPPAVYFGKLFYIEGTTRKTIKWSNENDPDTGYTGAQAWDFTQTSSSPISLLIGTNDALVVFRTDSITTITGQANEDFRSAGTLDSTSMTIGTKSPGSGALVHGEIWFLDQFARPQRIVPGQGVVPLWLRCYNTITNINPASLTDANLFLAWTTFITNLDIVLMCYVRVTGQRSLLAFHARTGEFLGNWTLTNITTQNYGVLFIDSTGAPALAMTEFGTSSLDWDLQKQDNANTVMSDVLASTTAVPFVMTTGKLVGDIDVQKIFTMLSVSTLEGAAGPATLLVSPTTSNGDNTQPQTTMQVTSVGAGNPGRATAPLDSMNTRWLQLQFNNTSSESTIRPVIGQVRLYGTQDQADPAAA